MLSDIEIAQKAKMKPIGEIAHKLGIPDSAIEPFGRTKAKISLDYIDTLKGKPDGKLILVTAINPTPSRSASATCSRSRSCCGRTVSSCAPRMSVASACRAPSSCRSARERYW